jgi:hypothetical protein
MNAYHHTTVFGHILVTFTTAGLITDTDWNQFMHGLEKEPVTKYLGVSFGTVEVSSVKRKQGAEILKRRRISAAIVNDDRLVRGMVTAVSWLGVDMKPFASADLGPAIHYLGGATYESRIVAYIDDQKRVSKAA